MPLLLRTTKGERNSKGGKRAKELFGPFKDFAGSIGRRERAMHKDQQQTLDQTQIGKRTSKGVLRDDFTEFFEIGAFTSDLRSGSGSLSTRTSWRETLKL